jgi:hypothetical protein
MGKLYVVDGNGKATNKMTPFIKVDGEYKKILEIYYGYNNQAVMVYPSKSYLQHFTVDSYARDFDVVLEG